MQTVNYSHSLMNRFDIPAQICTSLWFKQHFFLYLLFSFLFFSLTKINSSYMKTSFTLNLIPILMELFTTEFTITLSSATDIWFISLNTFRTRVQMTGAENTKAFFFLFPLLVRVSSGIQSTIVWEVLIWWHSFTCSVKHESAVTSG